jgi:hypothetical protein
MNKKDRFIIKNVPHANFNIINTYKQKLYKIKDVLDEDIIENIQILNKLEWCYVFIGIDYKLIIPCKLILEKFYFVNQIMKDALLKGHIKDLYNYYEFIPNKFGFDVKIDNNHKCTSRACLLLARMFFDERIMNYFKYHFFQLAVKKNRNTNNIRSYFPSFGKLNIYGKFKKILLGNKKDIYILDSFSAYTYLYGPFNDLIYNNYMNKVKQLYKFSQLNHKKLDSNRIYYQSDESYLYGKKMFYDGYINLEKHLERLHCKVKYSSEIKYLKKYINTFFNYSIDVVYNYGFYYLELSLNKIEYLVLVFNRFEGIEDFWVFENIESKIDDIDLFLKELFKYVYMNENKIDLKEFTLKKRIVFYSFNKKYECDTLLIYPIKYNIQSIFNIAIDEKYLIKEMEFNRQYPDYKKDFFSKSYFSNG